MGKKAGRGRGRPPDSDALYRRMATDLQRRISAGAWAGGKLLPSLRKLADTYRVAKRTAALAIDALKQDGWVTPTVRRRLTARNRLRSLDVDGNLVLELSTEPLGDAMGNLDFVDLQTGMTAGVGKLYAPLMIVHDRELQTHLPSRLAQLLPRGILLYGRFLASTLKRYEKLQLPVVLCDSPGEGFALHSVSVDNREGARDAVLRMAALGHRRIGFVQFVHFTTGKIDPDSKQRQEGFLAGMAEARLKAGRQSIYNFFPADGPQSPGIRRMLDAKPAYTAVLAVTASIGEMVVQGAQRMGKEVPRDLLVAGFQGTRVAQPAIPGPRIDFVEIGRRAALLLKEPARPFQHIKIPTRWADGV
jgi:DNA-binding LacI/PurR family transcriptional regulator